MSDAIPAATAKPARPPFPEPPVSPENEAFWAGTAECRLLIRRCTACGETHHYPRAHCPHCHRTEFEWLEASGTGTIYAFSVMLKAKEPYVLAYVSLPEGVTIMTNIVDCDFAALAIDQPVRVVFRQSAGGLAVPFFTPA
jgi:uncharacterized OB-fold protein